MTTEATDEDRYAHLAVPDNSTPPSELTDAQRLARRLYGLRVNATGQAASILPELRLWAQRPTLDNQAIEPITRDMPPEMRKAALITAALYAVHAERHPRSRPNAPIARLMRAFGSGTSYGPGHQATQQAMKCLLRTTTPDQTLPFLLRQIRYAAAKDMTPSWVDLAEDLSHWDSATRDKWAEQFYTSHPLNEIGIYL